MKLIFCPKCQDVVKLKRCKTFCDCNASWGYYKSDGLNAVINNIAIPLGFANNSLANALENRPAKDMGEKFTAFVIPKKCATIVVRRKNESL